MAASTAEDHPGGSGCAVTMLADAMLSSCTTSQGKAAKPSRRVSRLDQASWCGVPGGVALVVATVMVAVVVEATEAEGSGTSG